MFWIEEGDFDHRDHGVHRGGGLVRGKLRGVKAGMLSAVKGQFPRFGNAGRMVFQGLEMQV